MIYYLYLSGYTKHCSLSYVTVQQARWQIVKAIITHINLTVYLPKHIRCFLDISIKEKNIHNNNEINIIYIYIYIYIYVYTHTYIYIHTYTYVLMYIHTYIRMDVRTYVCMYIRTYICTYVHTHIHTYTYTYTLSSCKIIFFDTTQFYEIILSEKLQGDVLYSLSLNKSRNYTHKQYFLLKFATTLQRYALLIS